MMNLEAFKPSEGVVEKLRILVAQKKKEQAVREMPVKREPVVVGPKAGRNDPCPCGSGKKYKKCHLLLEGSE